MTDKPVAIDTLVASLTPAKRLSGAPLYGLSAALFCVLSVFFILLWELRPDFLAALTSGILYWKNGSLALLTIGGLRLMISLSRPVVTTSSWHAAPFVAAVLLLVYGTLQQPEPFANALTTLRHSDGWYCLGAILISGGLCFALCWRLWLQRTAPTHPERLGVAAGFTMAALAATAYAWHCDNDAALFIGVYYLGAIGLYAALGAWLGQRYLRW